jgi:hypothetical protein
MPGPVCFTATNERSVASLPQHPTRRAYREYLRTEHWKQVRLQALEYADYSCQVCNRAGEVHVHHRTYDRLGAERPADLTVLCARCHETHHGKGKWAEMRAIVEDDENRYCAQVCMWADCTQVLWPAGTPKRLCVCGRELDDVVVLSRANWERLLELLPR